MNFGWRKWSFWKYLNADYYQCCTKWKSLNVLGKRKTFFDTSSKGLKTFHLLSWNQTIRWSTWFLVIKDAHKWYPLQRRSCTWRLQVSVSNAFKFPTESDKETLHLSICLVAQKWYSWRQTLRNLQRHPINDIKWSLYKQMRQKKLNKTTAGQRKEKSNVLPKEWYLQSSINTGLMHQSEGLQEITNDKFLKNCLTNQPEEGWRADKHGHIARYIPKPQLHACSSLQVCKNKYLPTWKIRNHAQRK